MTITIDTEALPWLVLAWVVAAFLGAFFRAAGRDIGQWVAQKLRGDYWQR